MQFDTSHFSFSYGEHNQKNVIWIKFAFNTALKDYLKNNLVAKWSQSNKSWYVYDTLHNRNLFGLQPKSIGKEALSHIHPINRQAFSDYYNHLLLKAYSANTIRTYCNEFTQLLHTLKDHNVSLLNAGDLKKYFLYCIKQLKLSENHIHSRINAIKFYFEKVLGQDKFIVEIPRPKKPMLLPKGLNTDEIKKLFDVTTNIKHKVALLLCYGMGLRVSEIVNLKITDIDSKDMKVLIHQAKGKKDRYVHLPCTVLDLLRTYYIKFRPKEYLFEGQYGGAISVRSIQMIFKNAMKKAGINKPVGIHSLRHSYATHLLENGTDISLIQKLLGHNNIKTTLIYTQVTNSSIKKVRSPLDFLL